jgi:hypothetical protein
MGEPSKKKTEATPYAGYGGYYSTPEEASASIRAHSPRYGGGGSSSSSSTAARRDWSKNPPKTKEEWAQYMAEASITSYDPSQGDILYPAAIVTEHGVYPVTREGLQRTKLEATSAIYYEARREGDRIVYTQYRLSPEELVEFQRLSRQRKSPVSIEEVRRSLSRKKQVKTTVLDSSWLLYDPTQREVATRLPSGRIVWTPMSIEPERKKIQVEDILIIGPKAQSLTGEMILGKTPLWKAIMKLKSARGRYSPNEPGRRKSEQEEIKEELESRGIPIMPGEHIGVEEKFLLKGLKLSEKVAGEGSGLIGGARRAAGELVAGPFVTWYAMRQIIKHRPHTVETLKEPEMIAKEFKEQGKSWIEDFKGMSKREKLGYSAVFLGTLFAPQIVRGGRGLIRIAKTARIIEGKPVIGGELVTSKLAKAKVKAILSKPRAVDIVRVEPSGKATLKGYEPGGVKNLRSLEPERGTKIVLEEYAPGKTVEMNFPVEAEVASYPEKGLYKSKEGIRIIQHRGEKVMTPEGERGIVREKTIKRVVEKTPEGEIIKGIVEEHRTKPRIIGEEQRIPLEVDIRQMGRTKRGGMSEEISISKQRFKLKPIIVEEAIAESKLRIQPVIRFGRLRNVKHTDTIMETPKSVKILGPEGRKIYGRERLFEFEFQHEFERPQQITIELGRSRQLQKQKPILIQELLSKYPSRKYPMPKKPKVSKPFAPPLLGGGGATKDRKERISLFNTYKIKGAWRIGVKGEKITKLIFGERRKK